MISRISKVTKQKVSATVSPDRLRQALELTDNENVSEVIDQALEALVERELERRWLEGHADGPGDDLPGQVAVNLAHLPWDEEANR
jgi:post-segregation antitoxin (ccd killing protein)